VIDLEIVSVADAAEHRAEDGLVDVLDALAVRAHQVVVMRRDAGDVRGHVTWPFEPRRHSRLDLCLEGTVDRGESQTWIGAVQALVQLLRRDRLPFGGKCLRDDDALFRKASAA